SAGAESFLGWLVDFYVLATLLLAAALACLGFVRQPARRLAVAWATLGGLAVLAVLTTLPGWPRLSLDGAAQNEPPPPGAPAASAETYSVTTALETSADLTLAVHDPKAAQKTYTVVLTEADLHRLLKARTGKPVPARKDAAGNHARLTTTLAWHPSAAEA